MDRVLKLIKGYARKENNGWVAVPTTTLISTGNGMLLVDPGNRPDILDVLNERSVSPEEIKQIFITHHHLDHTMNIGLFTKASIIDNEMIHCRERIFPHDGWIPDTDVRIIPTPGHTSDHASLIVPDRGGDIMICGDLFWWLEDRPPRFERDSLLNLPDEFAKDSDALMKSRILALGEKVEKYVPGHGDIFCLSSHL